MKGSSSRSSSNGGTDTTGTLFEHTEKLADLIETIVTRGDPELDADLLKVCFRLPSFSHNEWGN